MQVGIHQCESHRGIYVGHILPSDYVVLLQIIGTIGGAQQALDLFWRECFSIPSVDVWMEIPPGYHLELLKPS